MIIIPQNVPKHTKSFVLPYFTNRPTYCTINQRSFVSTAPYDDFLCDVIIFVIKIYYTVYYSQVHHHPNVRSIPDARTINGWTVWSSQTHQITPSSLIYRFGSIFDWFGACEATIPLDRAPKISIFSISAFWNIKNYPQTPVELRDRSIWKMCFFIV